MVIDLKHYKGIMKFIDETQTNVRTRRKATDRLNRERRTSHVFYNLNDFRICLVRDH